MRSSAPFCAGAATRWRESRVWRLHMLFDRPSHVTTQLIPRLAIYSTKLPPPPPYPGATGGGGYGSEGLAFHTQSGAHTRRSVAIAGVLLFKGVCPR